MLLNNGVFMFQTVCLLSGSYSYPMRSCTYNVYSQFFYSIFHVHETSRSSDIQVVHVSQSIPQTSLYGNHKRMNIQIQRKRKGILPSLLLDQVTKQTKLTSAFTTMAGKMDKMKPVSPDTKSVGLIANTDFVREESQAECDEVPSKSTCDGGGDGVLEEIKCVAEQKQKSSDASGIIKCNIEEGVANKAEQPIAEREKRKKRRKKKPSNNLDEGSKFLFGIFAGQDLSRGVDNIKTCQKSEGWRKKEPGEKREDTRPTAFIAIQIANPEIHQKLTAIQSAVTARDVKLQEGMVSIPKLHLTLMVLKLDTEEDIHKASQTLDMCRSELEDLEAFGRELTIEGVGHFERRVVFAKVKENSEHDVLQTLAGRVKSCFTKNGLPSTDSRPFQAHATILKASKFKSRGSRQKKFDLSLFNDYKDLHFGKESIKTLQLCSMTLPKNPETNYYHVFHTTDLDPERVPVASINPVVSGESSKTQSPKTDGSQSIEKAAAGDTAGD